MIEVIKNKNLNNIVPTKCSVDDTSNLAYKVKAPLPKKSFAMYVCGRPGSGKTTTWLGLLTNKPTNAFHEVSQFVLNRSLGFFQKISQSSVCRAVFRAARMFVFCVCGCCWRQ